ncbi:LysR substrate-binding domain-containing protein [Mesorhizobium qingshengii]|uniref:LysR substrate-binding domain-containing protein n=1 Tax=Mesorhizobium qingshengii TaxID=1165689 RepID=UPI003B3B9259
MQAWEDWFTLAGFRPSRVTHGPVCPDFNFLFTAVLAGQWRSALPGRGFPPGIEHGDLIVLSDIASLTNEGYYIVTPGRRIPTVSNFLKWCLERVSTRAR